MQAAKDPNILKLKSVSVEHRVRRLLHLTTSIPFNSSLGRENAQPDNRVQLITEAGAVQQKSDGHPFSKLDVETPLLRGGCVEISLDLPPIFRGEPLPAMSVTPEALQKILDELEKSRASRRRAWENLQEIRWVLKDTAGVELPAPERKTIDLEGRIVKDGVRKALRERQEALTDLVHAIREYRKIARIKATHAARIGLRPCTSGVEQSD
jgi:hypothetical protein